MTDAELKELLDQTKHLVFHLQGKILISAEEDRKKLIDQAVKANYHMLQLLHLQRSRRSFGRPDKPTPA